MFVLAADLGFWRHGCGQVLGFLSISRFKSSSILLGNASALFRLHRDGFGGSIGQIEFAGRAIEVGPDFPRAKAKDLAASVGILQSGRVSVLNQITAVEIGGKLALAV